MSCHVHHFIISFSVRASAQDCRKTLKSCETRCVSIVSPALLCLGTDCGRIHKAVHNNSQLFVIAEYRPFEHKRHITGLTLDPPTVSNSTASKMISGVCGRSHISTKTNLFQKIYLFFAPILPSKGKRKIQSLHIFIAAVTLKIKKKKSHYFELMTHEFMTVIDLCLKWNVKLESFRNLDSPTVQILNTQPHI